jgi:hypothetical protein
LKEDKEYRIKKFMNNDESKLLSQIVDEFKISCEWFFSREDYCIYFIFEDTLYGYTDLHGLDVGNVVLIWEEPDTDYAIKVDPETNKERLSKQKTNYYNLLDYDALVRLYSKLNASRHLNNKNEES